MLMHVWHRLLSFINLLSGVTVMKNECLPSSCCPLLGSPLPTGNVSGHNVIILQEEHDD